MFSIFVIINVTRALKKVQRGIYPSNPIVNGFAFELAFFQSVKTSNSLTVKLRESVVTFCVPLVEEMDENCIVKCITVGILFHLRYKHPVIDGVGYLQENSGKIVSLVMIQVSLSPYKTHRSKLEDLFTKPTCPELKQQQTVASLLQYYEGLIPNRFKRNCMLSPKCFDTETTIVQCPWWDLLWHALNSQ